MADPATLADRLEELLAGMTPGPWRAVANDVNNRKWDLYRRIPSTDEGMGGLLGLRQRGFTLDDAGALAWFRNNADAILAALRAEPPALDVEAIVRGLTGYDHSITLDSESGEVSAGMTEAQGEGHFWQGDWVQKGAVVAALSGAAEPKEGDR